ncbi:MAG: hypothetical protein H7A51_17925 [Akkermansiaceae bacterium]|nr:hypothetical protein [Akkermansiaceae bacterium]
MDFLVFDEGDSTGASATAVADLEAEELVADELGLAVAVLMTMVVFGFPHFRGRLQRSQQKTVQ